VCEKIAQNLAQTIFCQNYLIPNFCHVKKKGYFYIFSKKLPLVNNRPKGENSSNLVTLIRERNKKTTLKKRQTISKTKTKKEEGLF
jgi:hypothetical protein